MWHKAFLVGVSCLMITVLGIGCKKEKVVIPRWSTKEINGLYSIELPSYLKEEKEMNAQASLQYCNPDSGLYIVALEDAKANLGEVHAKKKDIYEYYLFTEEHAFPKPDSMSEDTAILSEGFYFDDKNAKIKIKQGDYEVTQTVKDSTHHLFYRLVVIENKTHYFPIVIWRNALSNCDDLKLIDSITNSFKILPQSKSI